MFKAAKSVLEFGPGYDGPNIRFDRNLGGTASREAREFVREQMEPVAKALPRKWLEADSEAEQFAGFQKLAAEQKNALLAYCVASTLQPKLASEDQDDVTAYDIALSQTGANVADYWRPTKDNFLSRINSAPLLVIFEELFGAEFTKHRRNYKKAQLVSELDKAFADPENQISSDKLKNWLPAGMAFHAAPEPKPAKAKKSKKAA